MNFLQMFHQLLGQVREGVNKDVGALRHLKVFHLKCATPVLYVKGRVKVG